MAKCLVTKLNGSSNNSELLKLGELQIGISKVTSPSEWTQGLSIMCNKNITLEILGDGYFTDSTLSENKGKKITVNSPDASKPFYVSNGDFKLSILDKYSITGLGDYGVYNDEFVNVSLSNKTISDIDVFKYSKDISSINLFKATVSGDIANLGALTKLNYINLDKTTVSGDIANLGALTKLASLNLNDTKVSGDIASLKNLTLLTTIGLSNTKVSGDIANLKNLTKLNSGLRLTGLNLSGNIGDIPNNVLYFSNSQGKSNFTWTTSSRTDILAMENVACNNIDKLLQDMSKLNANFGGQQMQFKSITLIGTRTSASDAAVQTLQSKGYTVTIIPA